MKTSICLSLVIASFSLSMASASAGLITIDWDDPDNSDNGQATGTFGGVNVNLNSTNGGSTFGGIVQTGTIWSTFAGQDGVAGIGDVGVVNERAFIDWNNNQQGFATVTFAGGTVTDPILMFTNLDNVSGRFDFNDALTLTLLDQNPANTVSIAANNVVETDGTHTNGSNDRFSLQLSGTFSSISFNTNTNQSNQRSVGFSIATQDSNVATIPEPSSWILLSLGSTVLIGFRRRQRTRA